jgi:TolB-like protein
MGILNRRPAAVPIKEPVNRRLSSWKEIAAYLDTSVRTVQRWEQAEKLPVRRHEHAGGGTVYAYTQDLDAWLAGRTPEVAETAVPRHRRAWLFAAAALAAICALGWLFSRWRAEPPVRSLAVLPFQIEGGDANAEYLSAELPESITRGPARLPDFHVKVISHGAVARMKERKLDARQFGQLLQAEAVLTGRVTQRAQDLTVVVELVNVNDNTQIWGERFDRKLADVLTLQDQIAREIASRLHLRLSQGQREQLARKSTESAEAHRHYLRGRYHWNRRTEGGLRQAIEYFEKAIAEDPAYALAYAGLAESYAILSYYAPVSPTESAPKAIAAARRALEMDETLSEAWNALAQVTADDQWDWAEAEKHFTRAIQMNPRNADAYHWRSEFLAALGRFEEQRKDLERAAELDPLSPIIANNQGHVDYFARDFQAAEHKFRRAMADYPHLPNSHRDVGRVMLARGQYTEAIAELARARELGGAHIDDGLLVMAHALAGDRLKARSMQRELAARAQTGYVSPYVLIFGAIGLGETAAALGFLEQAAAERSIPVKWIGVDPLFDRLRGEPRFQALTKRMGLPSQQHGLSGH